MVTEILARVPVQAATFICVIYYPVVDIQFSWIGLSAMAAWGYTNEDDGTDGQQPRFTELARNYVREIGLIEKQSSMWFQVGSEF